MKETPRHKKAFEYYVRLGEKRSLARVGRKFKVSDQTMTNWNKAFHWQEKAKKRDEKNAKALANITDTQIVNQDSQNIKIARAAIKVFAQSLIGYVEHKCKCGEVIRIPLPKAKLTADQFDKMVRLERFIIGEPDAIQGHKITVEYVDPGPRVKPVESEVVDVDK